MPCRAWRVAVAVAIGSAMVVASAAPATADVPGTGIVRDLAGGASGWAWDKVAQGIAGWVLEAVGYFVNGIIDFLLTAAAPNVQTGWFAGADSPYATVRGIAIVMLIGFALLAVIQGLMQGEPGAMLRRISADLPLAVIGMTATTVVVARLIELTDSLSSAVLTHSDGQAVHFLSGFGAAASSASNGFAAVLIGVVAVLAGLVVWVELMVRSTLIYILVALSPLAFAAMIWPAARGVLRRTVELLLAVIVSKFVICVAIAIGVAALSGAGEAGKAGAAQRDAAAAGMGALTVGTAILAMAAFAPFLVLKLIPLAESAVVAQGMSRSPLRTAQSGMNTYNSASSFSRLAGGRSSVGLGSGATPVGAHDAMLTTGGAAGIAGAAAAGGALAAGAGRELRDRSTGAVETAASEPTRSEGGRGGTDGSRFTRGSPDGPKPPPRQSLPRDASSARRKRDDR